MTFHLDIPESIAKSLRLPAPEVEPRLRTELAVALYAQGILPFGKASELAELSRFAFADLVSQRNIPFAACASLSMASSTILPRA